MIEKNKIEKVTLFTQRSVRVGAKGLTDVGSSEWLQYVYATKCSKENTNKPKIKYIEIKENSKRVSSTLLASIETVTVLGHRTAAKLAMVGNEGHG